jgi:hypothetical protein
MSADSEFSYKQFNLMKLLIPLSKQLDGIGESTPLIDIYKMINENALILLDEASSIKDMKPIEKKVFLRSMHEILAEAIINNIATNGSMDISVGVSEVRELIIHNMDKDSTEYYGVNKKIIISQALYKASKPPSIFHNTLYFQDKIDSKEVKKYTSLYTKQTYDLVTGLIIFLAKNLENYNFDDKLKLEMLCDSVKLSCNMYADILDTMFEVIQVDNKRVEKYLKNPKIFIEKAKTNFMEDFSKYNLLCKKILDEL